MAGSERYEQMWLCQRCERWIGHRLTRCNTKSHPKPRGEIRTGDVGADAPSATFVARSPLWRRWYWKLRGRVRRWFA
jgi:hypothetical protein